MMCEFDAAKGVDGTAVREAYDREGYVIFRNVLDEALVAEASGHVDWLIARNPDLRPEGLDAFLVKDDPFWVHLVSDARLVDLAAVFLGQHIALFGSHYICKPPRDGQPVLWHQDGSYWPLEPMEVTTLWVAVDPSTPENGCMRVIPGTHGMELTALQERPEIASVLGSSMDESLVDESSAVDIVLQPGDVSVHHPNIIHGSEGNFSEQRRCGLTIRYIPTSTRILEKAGSPFLLRGEAVPGVNTYHEQPVYVEGKSYPFRGAAAYTAE